MIDDISRQNRTLLFLMPVPADDRWQAGVDGNPRAPAIERRIGFDNGGNAMDILPEPVDSLTIPLECDRPAFIRIDRCPQVRHSIDGRRGTIFEAVTHADGGSGQWI